MLSLYVDTLTMKHAVSQMHPNPEVRARAHLLLGIGAPYSYTVPINPEVMGTLSVGVTLLKDVDLSKGNQVNTILANHQHAELKDQASPITMMEPLKSTIDLLLNIEKQLFESP